MTQTPMENAQYPNKEISQAQIKKINHLVQSYKNMGISSLDNALHYFGYNGSGDLTEDTIKNIIKFQMNQGLKIDGIPGPRTMSAYLRMTNTEVNRHKKEVFSATPDLWYGKSITTSARGYLGSPYDTSREGNDGLSKKVSGEYFLMDNFTKTTFTSEKEPLVCIDLITKTLEKSGCLNMSDFRNFIGGNNPYDLRRVSNFERYVQSRPDMYTFSGVRKSIDYSKGAIPEIDGTQVGDIVTTRDAHGGRHIVIITAIDEKGSPTRCIHASGTRSGVVETAFYNTKAEKSGDILAYNPTIQLRGTNMPFAPIRGKGGEIRTDGAVPYQGEITAIIRPKPQTLVMAMNRSKNGLSVA